MEHEINKTIVVTGSKRSGTTLLNRLFDSHPELIDVIDECFFWEHVYNHQVNGLEGLFVDLFKHSDRSNLVEGLIDRELLPWLNGKFKQISIPPIEIDLGFNKEFFTRNLDCLSQCNSIEEIWRCLINAYALASKTDFSGRSTAFIREGDWGKSMLATKKTLKNCKCIYIIRNPYSALDSLKKGRELANRKILHPINFSQVLNHYFFFWNNKDSIIDDRTILIRYEDLLMQPREVMKRVADHVGIEFNETLMTPTLLGNPWGGGSSFSHTTGIDKSVLERSISSLNVEEMDLITVHLRPIIDFFDYKIPGTNT